MLRVAERGGHVLPRLVQPPVFFLARREQLAGVAGIVGTGCHVRVTLSPRALPVGAQMPVAPNVQQAVARAVTAQGGACLWARRRHTGSRTRATVIRPAPPHDCAAFRIARNSSSPSVTRHGSLLRRCATAGISVPQFASACAIHLETHNVS